MSADLDGLKAEARLREQLNVALRASCRDPLTVWQRAGAIEAVMPIVSAALSSVRSEGVQTGRAEAAEEGLRKVVRETQALYPVIAQGNDVSAPDWVQGANWMLRRFENCANDLFAARGVGEPEAPCDDDCDYEYHVPAVQEKEKQQ